MLQQRGQSTGGTREGEKGEEAEGEPVRPKSRETRWIYWAQPTRYLSAASSLPRQRPLGQLRRGALQAILEDTAIGGSWVT